MKACNPVLRLVLLVSFGAACLVGFGIGAVIVRHFPNDKAAFMAARLARDLDDAERRLERLPPGCLMPMRPYPPRIEAPI